MKSDGCEDYYIRWYVGACLLKEILVDYTLLAVQGIEVNCKDENHEFVG